VRGKEAAPGAFLSDGPPSVIHLLSRHLTGGAPPVIRLLPAPWPPCYRLLNMNGDGPVVPVIGRFLTGINRNF
jgi:hypothetical protein